MTVRDLLEVSPELKIKLRVIRNRKVVANIIENQAPIVLTALSDNFLDSKVSNVFIEHKTIFEQPTFSNSTKPILIINIED